MTASLTFVGRSLRHSVRSIDALLTAVSEIGERVGVPTPSTDALLGLTRVFAAGRGLY